MSETEIALTATVLLSFTSLQTEHDGCLQEALFLLSKSDKALFMPLTLFWMGVIFTPPNELSQISEKLHRPKACAFLYMTKI